jgi:CheY-like chemotaxis protein
MNDLHLKILRRVAELSGGSEKLAARLQVSHPTVQLWMQGKATIPPETAEKLVDLLLAADVAALVSAARKDPEAGLPRVLVVDDDPTNAYGLARILRMLGYAVDTASDGQEAIESARRNHPQVVFVDLRMPGMDGIQIADALRAEGLAPHVIAATAYHSELERKRTVDAGFSARLLKPIDRETLETLLSRLN